MDYGLTPEQQLFQRTVREFALKELLPKYQERDRTAIYPREQIKQMAGLGLTGLRIPDKYGGSEADYIMVGIAGEEIGRGDFSLCNVVIASVITGDAITRFGEESLKEEWLPRIASGEIATSVALSEPHCGSDATALMCRAERDGDHYVLNGEKTSVTQCDADVSVVFTRTGGSGAKGITAFLVPLDTPGVARSFFNDLGNRCVRRGALHLDNVRIPARYRIGGEGEGFYTIMNEFDYTRPLIGLACLGVAAQAVEETIEYVKTRVAFGQPLAKFEGVSFPIAEALTKINAGRHLCYHSLWLRQEHLPHTKEAAMAKWYGPKLSAEICHKMLLLHGHAGYSDDHRVAQRLRDVIGFELGDGTAEVMNTIIAREAIGKEFRPY